MGRRYDNILQTIGDTPVVRLNRMAPQSVNVFVKIEAFNPMGSVKDRLALGVIEDAERRGALKPGQTVVEATSGNTGIGLAMVCAQRGYPLVVTMAENFSIERRKLLRFLGAKVVLTPASEKGSGMVAKAAELAREHGWWQAKQFENPANAEIHARTTAVEILDDFSDVTLDYWVTGYGTGGTLNGVARVLKAKSPRTKIVACEPDNSPVLGSGIPQPRNADGSHSASHPLFRPHLMQGWSPDFIPKLAEQTVQAKNIDQYIAVNGDDALRCSRELARKEGIFVGISAGATLAGALQIAQQAPRGANILCMLPDTGERYLSTPLFQDVSVDMTAEEQAISRSTPGYRFDVCAAPAAPAASAPPALDAGALKQLEEFVRSSDKAVVMFALEWCEFCWAVRKLLTKYEIPHRVVSLDSVEYQDGNRGGKIRDALRERTAMQTLPQIFLGGEFIGGCSELFDRCRSGQLGQELRTLDIPFNASVTDDPNSFLPGWLHAR